MCAETDGLDGISRIMQVALSILLSLMEMVPCSQSQVIPSHTGFCTRTQMFFFPLITKPTAHNRLAYDVKQNRLFQRNPQNLNNRLSKSQDKNILTSSA